MMIQVSKRQITGPNSSRNESSVDVHLVYTQLGGARSDGVPSAHC